jgi:hypothetical protein
MSLRNFMNFNETLVFSEVIDSLKYNFIFGIF